MDKPLSEHLKSFILPFLMLIALPAGDHFCRIPLGRQVAGHLILGWPARWHADRPGRAGAAGGLHPADHRLRQHHSDALDPLREVGGPRPLPLCPQPDDSRCGAGDGQRGIAAGVKRHPDPGAGLFPGQHGVFHTFGGTQAGRALR